MPLAFCNSCQRRDFDYNLILVCPDCNLPLTPVADTNEEAQGQERDQAPVPEVGPSTKEEEELRKAWIKMLNDAIDRYHIRSV